MANPFAGWTEDRVSAHNANVRGQSPLEKALKDIDDHFNTTIAKVNKYHAEKVTIDGITFHSKKEGARYQQLCMLEKAGQISYLTLQKSFELAPACTIAGKKKPPLRYVADFVYIKNDTPYPGETIIEDCKGFRDKVYILKRHLMKTVLGIDILET